MDFYLLYLDAVSVRLRVSEGYMNLHIVMKFLSKIRYVGLLLLFLSTFEVVHGATCTTPAGGPFQVVSNLLIRERLQVQDNLEVCGNVLIGGDLRVCGQLGTNTCGELVFTSMDLGIVGCAEGPMVMLNGSLFSVYPTCESNRASRSRVVELLFQLAADQAMNRLPYLDFSIPNDFDNASGRVVEIDVHFVTVLDEENEIDPATGSNISMRLHFDHVGDGGTIGIDCGQFTTDNIVKTVTQPVDDRLNHYKVTFCIPATEVANINPMDFARIMFVRLLNTEFEDDPYNQNVFLIGATFRYPQETQLCPTECTVS